MSTKLTEANVLPAKFRTSDKFISASDKLLTKTNSERERYQIEYIRNLLKRYIAKRQQMFQLSDKRKVDAQLLLSLQNQIEEKLIDFISSFDKLFDLDTELVSSLNTKNQTIKSEIINVLQQSLKNIIEKKLSVQITNKVKIGQILKQLNKLRTDNLDEAETKTIVKDIFNSKSTIITKAKKEFGEAQERYRNVIIQMFDKGIFQSIEGNNKKYNKESAQVQNDIKNENNLKNKNIFRPFNNTNTNKALEKYYSTKLSFKIFDMINYTLSEKVLKFFGNAVSKLSKYPKKIISSAVTAVKNLISKLTKGIFSAVINLVVKPIIFLITKPLKAIFKSISFLSSVLKKAFTKTNIGMILLTPPGMYMLGFMVGFVWERLKELLPQTVFSIDGIAEFISKIGDMFFKIRDAIISSWEAFNKLKPVKDIKEFIGSLIKNGWSKTLDDTYYGNLIKNALTSFQNSSIFKLLSWCVKTIYTVGSWIAEHPVLSAAIWGGVNVLAEAIKFKRFLNFVGAPIGGIKGIASLAIASMTAYTMEKSMDSLFEMFDSYNNTQIKFKAAADNLSKEMILMGNDYEIEKYKNLDQEHLQKYQFLRKFIMDEKDEIEFLNRKIEVINAMGGENGDITAQTGGDLYNTVPTLINRIVTSNLLPKNLAKTKQLEDTRETSGKEGNVKKQLALLKQILSIRTNQLASLANTMNYEKLEQTKYEQDENGQVKEIKNNLMDELVDVDKDGNMSLNIKYKGLKAAKQRMGLDNTEKENQKVSIWDNYGSTVAGVQTNADRKRQNAAEARKALDEDAKKRNLDLGIDKIAELEKEENTEKLRKFLAGDSILTDNSKNMLIRNMIYYSTAENREKLLKLIKKVDTNGKISNEDQLEFEAARDAYQKERDKVINERAKANTKEINDIAQKIDKETDKLREDNDKKVKDLKERFPNDDFSELEGSN